MMKSCSTQLNCNLRVVAHIPIGIDVAGRDKSKRISLNDATKIIITISEADHAC